MKHRYYAILGLLFLASLTACGNDDIEIETYHDPSVDACFAEVHVNKSGDRDDDYKFAIPCVVINEKVDDTP